MKKFFIKIVTFFLVLCIIILSLNFLYTRSYGYKKVVLGDTEKFYHVPYNINICNFGSSHGVYGFKYDDKNSFNFAMSAQDFYYDFLILKQYSSHLSLGCKVLIPVSYFSFGVDPTNPKITYINPRYYAFINDYKKIRDFSYKNLIIYKLIPIFSAGKNFEYIYSKEKKISEQNQMLIQRRNEVLAKGKKMFIEGEKKSSDHKFLTYESQYNKNKKILIDMIDFCKKKGFKPILITTPYSEEYNDSFDAKDYYDFYKNISDIQKKEGIPYFDYSHDERFQSNKMLFLDVDHLNLTGREKFSKIVLKEITS